MLILFGGAIPRLRRFAAEIIYVDFILRDIDEFEGGWGAGVFGEMYILLDNTSDVIHVAEGRKRRENICVNFYIRRQ